MSSSDSSRTSREPLPIATSRTSVPTRHSARQPSRKDKVADEAHRARAVLPAPGPGPVPPRGSADGGRAGAAARRSDPERALPYVLAAELAEALPALGISELARCVLEQDLHVGRVVGAELEFTFRRARDDDAPGFKPVDFTAVLDAGEPIHVTGSLQLGADGKLVRDRQPHREQAGLSDRNSHRLRRGTDRAQARLHRNQVVPR